MSDESEIGFTESLLLEELQAYREALFEFFEVKTDDPFGALQRLSDLWQEERRALLDLVKFRCSVCEAPATRELTDQETFFCDSHGFDHLPRDIQQALIECGAVEEGAVLTDIPWAYVIRKAIASLA